MVGVVLGAALQVPGACISQIVWCAEACAEAVHVPGREIFQCVLDSQQDTGKVQSRTCLAVSAGLVLLRQVQDLFCRGKHHNLPLNNPASCWYRLRARQCTYIRGV